MGKRFLLDRANSNNHPMAGALRHIAAKSGLRFRRPLCFCVNLIYECGVAGDGVGLGWLAVASTMHREVVMAFCENTI